MKYCTKCGHKNDDDSLFCIKCGESLENAEDHNAQSTQKSMDDIVSAGKDVADKVVSDAKKAMGQVAKKIEKEKEKINRDIEQMSARYEAENGARAQGKTVLGSEYMSKTELWSWLKRQSQRQKYFTEEKSELSFKDFIGKVNNKLKENEIPASLEVRKIQWDRGNVSQSVCYVKPDTRVANPLTRLIHFEHIGKFTFVEEKTFITPPDLPEIPKKKLAIPSKLKNWILFVLLGFVLILSCVVALTHYLSSYYGVQPSFVVGFVFWIVCGTALLLYGIYLDYKYQAIIKHNKKCIKQEQDWYAAWNNWHQTIFTYAFQEDINGHLSRIFDAVSACVKQVSEEEFKDALISVKEEEDTNMNELEEMIRRRQEEYR